MLVLRYYTQAWGLETTMPGQDCCRISESGYLSGYPAGGKNYVNALKTPFSGVVACLYSPNLANQQMLLKCCFYPSTVVVPFYSIHASIVILIDRTRRLCEHFQHRNVHAWELATLYLCS